MEGNEILEIDGPVYSLKITWNSLEDKKFLGEEY